MAARKHRDKKRPYRCQNEPHGFEKPPQRTVSAVPLTLAAHGKDKAANLLAVHGALGVGLAVAKEIPSAFRHAPNAVQNVLPV